MRKWKINRKVSFLRITLKGSYTVEASLVVPILLLIIEGTILLGFRIYSEGLTYLTEVQVMEMQSVEKFRLLQAGEDVIENIMED
ncbi:MAG: pilus assembly protein [Lachnospiraceae bacterium]|nr:pilus assembly protein [Lachnospiraceae bacterium]